MILAEGSLRIYYYWNTGKNKMFLWWGAPSVLRVFNPPYNKIPRWLPTDYSKNDHLHDIVNLREGKYVEQGNLKFRINNFGMIGKDIQTRKPQGVKRILVLGDATTFVIGQKKWPTLLEKRLNHIIKSGRSEFQVLNGAFEGHNSFHLKHLFFDFKWTELKPDLLIIYSGVFDYQNLIKDLKTIQLKKPFRWQRNLNLWSTYLSRRSLFYREIEAFILRNVYGSSGIGHQAREAILSADLDLTPREIAQRREIQKKHLSKINEQFQSFKQFRASPVYTRWRNYFINNLAKIIEACRDQKVPVIMLKGPFLPGPDNSDSPYWWRHYQPTIFTAIDELTKRYPGTYSIDLDTHFRKNPDHQFARITHPRSLYTWYWHGGLVHPSTRGANLMSAYIMKEIIRLGIFQGLIDSQ